MRGFIEAVVGEAIALLQLRATGGMAFAMANAQVLADKGAIAIRKIASKDLFRGICMGKARGMVSFGLGRTLQRSIAYGSTDAGTNARRANNSSHIPRVYIRICDRRERADCVGDA